MPVPESDRKVIQQALSELRVAIDNATKAQAKNPRLAELLPDLEIFHKAADWALKYNEFFKESEFKSALEVIAEGRPAPPPSPRGGAVDDPEGSRGPGLSLPD